MGEGKESVADSVVRSCVILLVLLDETYFPVHAGKFASYLLGSTLEVYARC